ncbi:tubulin-specific chaperone C isoform X1 [Plutella xylostella]|nr:tubulin-specific chaperone C isoform X1 [Plutella xylostella]
MTDKNSVLERLSRRDAQRLEKLQKAHKAREDIDPTNEKEDYFTDAFKLKSDYVDSLLSQIPTLETTALSGHFDIIKKEINEMHKYIVTSSLFLKEYNMRKSLSIVQDLQNKCYELEEKYVPRKRFGFSKKKLAKPEEQKSSVMDEIDSIEKKYASKWDEKLFGFDNKENEVLLLDKEDLFQRDVSLRHLKNCTVFLKGAMGTLHITDLENCLVLSGPVMTSVFVERCSNSKLVVACQQLRMHTSSNCDIYLHVTCKGIIEDCTNIRTAPYSLHYEELDKHYELSALDRSINHWDTLDDFNWLAPNVPSPNWSILDKTKRVTDWEEHKTKIPS